MRSWDGNLSQNAVKLYEELGWESLSERRMCQSIRNRTPGYLRDKMPPNRRNLANLCYAFQGIKCRTDRYFNSFFPDAISVWNNIISNFEYLRTLGRLKTRLNFTDCPKLRSTFDLHDPVSKASLPN